MANQTQTTPVLKVSGLQTHFFTSEGTLKAVDGVDFAVGPGEVLGLVGESGCGKSVTALSVLRLIPSPPGRIVGGTVEFQGQDLLSLSEGEIRKIRGQEISMIFQDPLTSLNPVLRIGYQVAEVFRFHRNLGRSESLQESIRMLRRTEIPAPEFRVKHYPHEMSGGMRQRVMIAMGLACEPSLLIADEPTTALDVTVQAQVLRLMRALCQGQKTALILITHDMGVVANMCDRVAVMYAGRIVEISDTLTVFERPGHPYTAGLLRSLARAGRRQKRLESIEGQPPQLSRLPRGCAFSPRCPYRKERCLEEPPGLSPVSEGHDVRCHFPIGSGQ